MAERVAYSLLLSVGANGTILFLLGLARLPLTMPVFFASVVLSIVIGVIFGTKTTPAFKSDPVASALLVLPFLLAAFIVANTPLADYDGRATWLPKAHAIAHEKSIDGPFFHGERGLNLHNRYPLLLPLNAAAVGESAARWLYLLIPLALLVFARTKIDPWIIAAAAWLPALLVATDGGITSAYADLTVASFFGMALLDEPRAGIWLAFLILTKNEGLMLAAVFVIADRFRHPRQTIAPALAVLLLFVWHTRVPEAYDERYSVLLRDLDARRFVSAARALIVHALDVRRWGLFWPLVAISARLRAWFPLALVTLGIAGYVVAFAVTSWKIDELAQVSADRLLLHLLIPGCMIVSDYVKRRHPSLQP